MPFIPVPLGELYVALAGEGPLAVFIHGGLLDHGIFLPQLEGLARLRRCAAIDLRGFGRSSELVHARLDDDGCAADVAAVIDALGGGPVDLVGLSIGASVALSLAIQRPETAHTLAMFSSRLAAMAPDQIAAFRSNSNAALADGRRALGESFAGRMVAEGADPFVVARIRSMVERTPYETVLATYERNIAARDHLAELGQLRCPVLIAAGEHDPQVPVARLHELAAGVGGTRSGAAGSAATVAVIAGSGHLVTLEQPDEVNRLLAELWASAG